MKSTDPANAPLHRTDLRRRPVLVAGLAPFLARAQPQPARPWRLGFLTHHDAANGEIVVGYFTTQMRARGLEQGRDYLLEVRFGNLDPARIAAGARELAAMQPMLLLCGANASATALLQATRTIPIVAIAMTNPVQAGMVQSLSRPGGNLTGGTFNQPEFAGKMLDVLKAAAPRVTRVAVVRNPSFPGMAAYTPHAIAAAQRLGVELVYVEVTKPEDFRVEMLDRAAPDALYVAVDFVVHALVPQLVFYAALHRLPSIGTVRVFAQAGGLLSLDADPHDQWRVGADYAIRILTQGASPATLPVQEPTKYRVILHRGTAEKLRIALSQELMLRVTEVIA